MRRCCQRNRSLVARSLLALLLTGTLNTPALAAKTRVTIWHQLNYGERVVLDQLCRDFQRTHPSIEVVSIFRETEELRSGFRNSALAGSGPELVHGPSDQVGPFATMGLIRPLETVLGDGETNRLDPNAAVWFAPRDAAGRLQARHLFQLADRLGNHLTLVCNRKLVPVPPGDSDELLKIAQAHTADTDGDGKIDHFGLVWNYTEPYFFVPFLGGFGGWVMDEQNNPTLDTAATRNALQYIIDLRDRYKVIPPNCDYETAHNLFLEGAAAMIINGDWSWGAYLEAGMDIGIARIPLIRQTGLWPTPMVSPRGYSINVNTRGEKLRATLEVLRFLLSDQAQERIMKATRIMPTSLAVLSDEMVLSDPIMAGSRAQLEVGRPMPVAPELRAVWDSMRPAYQAVLGGAMTAGEAAASMQRESLKKIREMNTLARPARYVPVMLVVVWLLVLGLILGFRRMILQFLRDVRRNPFVYVMALPALAVLIATVIFPFAYNVALSVSNMGLRNFKNWEIVGFENYLLVFREPTLYQVLGKTVIWTFVNVAFHVAIGVALALLLNRALPGKGALRTLLILPWAVPQYITALTWRGMFNQEYGAINLIINRYLHMPVVNWLGSPFEMFTACILTNVWLGFAFMMIVALGGLQSIPEQLYDAAEIDGAGAWAKFRHITIPLLKPVMMPAIILGVVWTFNNLNVIWLVSNAGEPSDQTHILVSFVYKNAFNLYRYSYAAAMSMVIFAILLVFGIFFLRKTKATETVY